MREHNPHLVVYAKIRHTEDPTLYHFPVFTPNAQYRKGEYVAVYKFAGWAEADVQTTMKTLHVRPESRTDSADLDE